MPGTYEVAGHSCFWTANQRIPLSLCLHYLLIFRSDLVISAHFAISSLLMRQPTDWDVVAANPEFKALMRAKKRFIIPATIFFVAYYFALPILVGYAPKFMATPVLGPVNIAYLFALSQFFVAWFIAFLYVRAAARFDEQGRVVLEHLDRHNQNLERS